MTAEELFELQDDGYRYELVDGDLGSHDSRGRRAWRGDGVASATCSRNTSIRTEEVSAAAPRQGSSCGARRTSFVPRTPPSSRANAFRRDGIPKSYWPFAPDLAVEVPSPNDRFSDVHLKIAEYFAAGTRLVWIVEPATRRVHVHRSPHDVQVIEEDGELIGDDVLPGFRCAVKTALSAVTELA